VNISYSEDEECSVYSWCSLRGTPACNELRSASVHFRLIPAHRSFKERIPGYSFNHRVWMNSPLSRKMNSLKRLHYGGSGLKATQTSLPYPNNPLYCGLFSWRHFARNGDVTIGAVTALIVQPSVPSITHSENNQSWDADWILPVKCKWHGPRTVLILKFI